MHFLVFRCEGSHGEEPMVAATAHVHHLTFVTRSIREFARFKIATLNPFK